MIAPMPLIQTGLTTVEDHRRPPELPQPRGGARPHAVRVPSYFLKPPSSLAGDGDPVVRPAGASCSATRARSRVVDRHARAHRVAPTRRERTSAGSRPPTTSASTTCAGPTAAPTCSPRARTASRRSGRGSSPAAEVDLGDLTLRTLVNGELVQEDITANLIFPFARPRRRPLALHDARAGRRHPHRHAGRLAAARARRRRRGRDRGRRERRATRSSRPSTTLAPLRRDAEGHRRDARRGATASPRRAPAVALRRGARTALRHVSTATLTVQLQRRGIRNTFMRGLRPTRPDLRLVGYAHTLRYVAAARGRRRRGHRRAERAEARGRERSRPARCS